MGAERARVGKGTPIKSPFAWALLGLVIERPSYGYELANRFEKAFDGILKLSSRSYVYTTLDGLQGRAMIEQFPGRGAARQPRPCYRATRDGLRSYQKQLVAQIHEDRQRSRLLARELAVFAQQPEAALEVIESVAEMFLDESASLPAAPRDASSVDEISGLAARLEHEEARLAMESKLPWVEFARREFKALAGRRIP
jgi:DNA-binding PadR family transcriptional regulator